MPEEYYIASVLSGLGDAITLEVRWNGTKMILYLDHNSSYPDATENAFIKNYTSAFLVDDADAMDASQDEILDAIVEAGESLFDELAPHMAAPPSDLHSMLFSPQYSFILITVLDKLELLPKGSCRFEMSQDHETGYERAVPIPGLHAPEPEFPTYSYQLNVDQIPQIPRHVTTDITVVENLLGEGYICHVLVNGRDMCSKVAHDSDVNSMQRELDCLAKITAHTAQHTASINIPKLLGLIETPGDAKVIGILEEIIPQPEGVELSTLGRIEDVLTIPTERRKAWAAQIRKTVDWLHSIGVIWGDGKADNVLIHSNTDEAWLIDFGGGATVGWVDENLVETAGGDDQAVERIYDFLQLHGATRPSC